MPPCGHAASLKDQPMSKTITTTYTSGVTFTSVSYDPTTITSTGLLQQGLQVLYDGAWQVLNQGTIQGAATYGIYLFASGTVTNQGGGYIGGDKGGIAARNAALTVVNYGGIYASNSDAILLFEGGSVTNQTGGTIAGYPAIYGSGAAVTVVNAGAITGTGAGATGVELKAGGTIGNQIGGTISGYTAIYGGGAPLTVTNAGTIVSTGAYGAGIEIRYGGYVINQSSGTISGSTGIYGANQPVTVVNYGSIAGGTANNLDSGVELRVGGSVTNQSGGTISGYEGIYGGNYGALTVVNYGDIAASGNAGVFLAGGGTIANQAGGTISGGFGVLTNYAAATVVNYGTIIGSELDGVALFSGGYVTNQIGGIITGYDGVTSINFMTVVNAGSIAAAGYYGAGVYFMEAGSVTNQSGGTITGYYGIKAGDSPLTVVNAGNISENPYYQYGTGVLARGGGGITNQAGGTISGGTGIYGGFAGPMTVVNAGTITGYSGYGISMMDGGSVTNQAGGIIGGYHAIEADYALTVLNGGTIAAYRGAIGLFGGGYVSNQSGGTIGGTVGIYSPDAPVTVVNAGNILGGSAGGLIGGVVLVDGGTITNETGGTITGYDAIYGGGGAGLTVVNAGSILGGSTGRYAGGVVLVGGGTVTNETGGTISGYDAIYGGRGAGLTVINAGTVTGYTYGAVLHSGGYVNNQTGGTISGLVGIAASDPATVVNAGTILGNMSVGYAGGVVLVGGGTVTNETGGTIAGYDAIYGGGSGGLTVSNASSIAGYEYGVVLDGGGYVTNQSGGIISGYNGVRANNVAVTVVNAGTITAAYSGGTGVVISAGGTVINQSGGTITGSNGIYGENVALTVINSGSISGYNQFGVALFAGGYLTNQSGGTISSGNEAVYGAAVLIVVNDGSITAYGSDGEGIDLNAGGGVTNLASGTISGQSDAIVAYNDAVPVVNYGRIAAYGASGKAVDLVEGGSVTNQAGGTISGYGGIYGPSGGMTVVNAGTIIGSGGTAVQLTAGYTNLLTIDPGAVFAGTVDGGNAIGAIVVSTLELAPGVSIGTLSGLGTQFIDFGQTTIDSGAYWVLNGSNTLAAGTTLTNSGTLAVTGATFFDTGLVINDGTIVIDPSNVTFGSLTGTGDLSIDSGSTLNVIGTVSSGETIIFSGISDLLGVNPTAFAGQINGFTVGDTIDLAGVTDGSSPQIVNGNTLEIQRSDNPPVYLTLDPGVDYTGDTYAINPTGAVTEVAPCFVTGTLIRTERGDVPVELLQVGDRVVTLSGPLRPIRWIGHRRLDLTRHPTSRAIQPIVIRAHAFGDGTPTRDLFLSPEHAVLMDGVLVPVRLLVNGTSIQREQGRRRVTYYHVELETHDILLAEALAVESYLETGNRGMFENAGEPLLLHLDMTNDQARRVTRSCAPFTDDPDRVEPLWRALAERAAQAGWTRAPAPRTTDDAALHLIVNGLRIAPISVARGKHTFIVPAGVRTVLLRSRTAIPSDMAPWLTDDRRLGVLLRGLTLRSGADALPIPLDHPDFGTGWWQVEWHDPVTLRRWTDGDAVVPMPRSPDGTCLLEVEVAATLPYPLPLAASDPPPIRHSA
jgi:hypothetical protein